jgi:DNA invertase Pin-like site-specific DNA recombinase
VAVDGGAGDAGPGGDLRDGAAALAVAVAFAAHLPGQGSLAGAESGFLAAGAAAGAGRGPAALGAFGHGLTGTNRNRPGLGQALAAVREGDTLVAPKPDRLARSVPDARAISDALAARGIEVDLLRMRAREGMAVARAKGKLRGKQPKLAGRQQRDLVRMAGTGEFTIADLAEVFTVSRATVYRTLQRTPAADKAR